jgi:hypothetical protein
MTEAPPVKIFIGIPCYDKKVCVSTVQSLMNAMQALLLMEVPFEFKFEPGCPYVTMARNNLVRRFMASECTDLVFIDADLGFSPQAFRDLITSTEDVIGGAYPKKQAVEEFAVSLATDANHHPVNENGVLLAEGLATGFLKIRRHVLEKMQDAYPQLAYRDCASGLMTHDLFGTFVKKGRWYGDDYGFCHLWSEIGGKMHCLPNVDFIHEGSKGFSGNFHEFMQKQAQYPPAVQKARVIDGFMTDQELEWLLNTAGRMGSVVELGSWKGRSATVLLEGCKGMVTCVDNWTGHDPSSNGILSEIVEKEDVFQTFQRNVGQYPNLRVARGNSSEMAACVEDADMVFIDAEHTYEGCKANIEAWRDKAKRVIAGHDFSENWPGVMRAVKEAFGVVKTVGTIWYVEVGGGSAATLS